MSKSHCRDCVKNDEDCCSSFHSRFLTIRDAERITQFLQKREGVLHKGKRGTPSVHRVKPREFLTYAELKDNDKESDLYLKKPHGYYYDLAVNGRILQIKDGKKGECLFFKKGHCSVYPVRPLTCRVFPFWFSMKGDIIVDNNGYDCPIVCGKEPLAQDPSKEDVKAGLRKIGYDEKEIVKLIYQLIDELDGYRKNIASFVKRNGI